jgi:prepilin-type N-terminal cleavage/methylation domain-containing protein
MRRAFSLLEVMIAMAILSMGMVLLLQSQSRSMQLAQQGRAITVATMLARGKLYDCQQDLLKQGFSIGDYSSEGNFDEEGYPKFYWECHAYQPELPVPSAGEIANAGAGGGGPLGGAVGGAVDAAKGQGQDLGMQVIAPFLAQLSGIMGDSIRELVVIVRWSDGGEGPLEEMRVATHVIDKTAVNNISQMIGRQVGSLPGGTKPDPNTNPDGTSKTKTDPLKGGLR